jgi:hypothetical protein
VLEKQQLNYELSEVEVELKRRNVDHTKSLGLMKYIFVFCTLAALIIYYKAVRLHSTLKLLCRSLTSKWRTWD